MKNHVLSSLVSVLFFGFATAAWADMTIPGDACPEQLTGDVTIDGCGKVTVSDSIDLNGHSLTLNGISGLLGTGTITDSTTEKASPGKLHLDVTADFSALTVVLTGNMRLVKEGAKTLTMAYSSASYAGGNEVNAGTLKIGTTSQTIANFKPLGSAGSEIVVNEGGTLDVNGKYGFKDVYAIKLNGGTLANTGTRSNIGSNPFNAEITLAANSTFKTSKEYNYAGKLNLNGYTLTLNLSNILHWGPSAVDAGTIVLGGTKNLQLEKNSDLSDVSFRVGGLLNLQTYTLRVKDYVANDATCSGTGALQVSGTFTPTSDNFYPCTLMKGSTIDLSTKETTWSLSNAAGAAAQFAAGATVTIDVGVREIAAGDKIVEWSEGTEYAGREFVLKTNGATSEDFELQVSATGLTVAARGAKVPTATWTGAVSADAANPDNWSWANVPEPTPGLTPGGSLNLTPGPTTAVVIPWDKLATISWPDTTDLSFATIEFAGEKPTETVVIDGDRDWRGLGPMDIPFALDLNGHKLYLVLPGAASVNKTEVTSSVEGGELHATVATDKVHDNTSVALTGNLTLIKEGPGTFVQTLTTQSYSGETRVVEGVLATASGDMSAEGVSLFGADKSVTVAAGGALDPRGSYNWSDYTIVLNGGMISNTVANIGTNNDNTQYNVSLDKVNRRFNPNVTLLDDSTFATTKTYTFFATVDSNGYELRNWIATDAEVRWQPKTKTGGMPLIIDVVGGGELFILKNCSLNQPTMTLKMTDGWVTMGGNMVVSNYVAASEKNSFAYKNDTAVLKVSGTFTPTTQRFIGCTMQNGSTIDLSGKTEPWKSQGFAWGKGDVDFAAGATVTIDVGVREFKGMEQIVTWSEGSKASAATATFVLNAAAKAKGYCLMRDANGLSVGRKGLVLLFQ